MGKLVRLADDEVLEREAGIEMGEMLVPAVQPKLGAGDGTLLLHLIRRNRTRRAITDVVVGRGADFHPAGSHHDIDRLDARLLTRPESPDAVGVMRQDPVPHESGGHGDADLTALQLADRQRFQPAPVRRLTHFVLEAATYPRPLLIQRTAHRHAHQLLLQRPAGSAVRLPEIFDRLVRPGAVAPAVISAHGNPSRAIRQQRTGHARPAPSRKKVGLCRISARISHEHFGRSAVTHCPRGHNVQARPGCTGQNLSLSAKLKPLPFTIHIFSSNRMPRRKTASTLPSVTQFSSPAACDRHKTKPVLKPRISTITASGNVNRPWSG